MATAITNIQTVLNTAVVATATLATADTNDLAEVFTITPTKSKMVFIINNTGAAGTVTYSLAVGTEFAKTVALTGSVLQTASRVFEVDTAKYVGDLGALSLTVTPAAGIKLKTGNIVTIQAIQLV